MDDEYSLDSNYGNDSSQLDQYDSGNDSGTVAYNPDTATQATSGGVVNSSSNPLIAPPDASGGNGSFLTPLQNAMTQGLSDTLVSATEFGFGALTDRLAVITGQAQPVYAAAPAKSFGFSASISPGILIAIGAIIFILVVAE